MTDVRYPCAICDAEAQWECVRPPTAGQLDLLCDVHYRRLQERNGVLAARYDRIRVAGRTETLRARRMAG